MILILYVPWQYCDVNIIILKMAELDMNTDLKEAVGSEKSFSINFGSDMCRACLTDKNLQSLFNDQEFSKSEAENIILKMFISCTALEASWNDQYPKHICNNCLDEMVRAYKFWRKCRNSVDEINKIKEKIDLIDIKEEIDPLIDHLDIILEDNETNNVENKEIIQNNLPNLKNTIPRRKSTNKGQLLQTSITAKASIKKWDKKSRSEGTCIKHEKKGIEKEILSNQLKNFSRNNSCFVDIEENSKTFGQIQQCSKCKIKFIDYNDYMKHVCRLTEENYYPCEQCDQSFETRDMRYKHVRMYHTSSLRYICDVCPKAYKTSLGLEVHKRIHTGEKPYSCNLCEAAFKSRGELETHSYKHTSERKYQCSQCGKGFNRPFNLKEHMKVHFGVCIDQSYLCKNCGRVFKTLKNLQVHEAIHSSLRPFECTKCKKSFKSKSYLQTHMRVHVEEKKYACDHCDQRFTTWHSKSSHIKIHHMTEKPFVCKICSKAFKFSGKLIVHERQHSGEKPYPCSECDMSFVCSSSLKMHMLKHTGERKHLCPVCDKTFSRAQHVKQHMVTHTGERKHKCKICSKGFTQAHVLRSHMKTHEEIVVKEPNILQNK